MVGLGERCLVVAVGLALASAATAQVQAPGAGPGQDHPGFRFVRVDGERGLTSYSVPVGIVFGLASADIDNDGDIDLFVPTGGGTPNRMYLNDGNGFFQESALQLGLASMSPARGGLFVDVDADGRLDLIVTQDDFLGDGTLDTVLRLYLQNAGGTFDDVTLASGLFGTPSGDSSVHQGGLCAGDFDADGDLDVCAARWEGEPRLLRNQGGGVFVDDSAMLGAGYGFYWQPLAHDLNGDGACDLFMAHDFLPNRLLLGAPVGMMVDVAASAGVDTSFNEMGAALGDIDEDGDFEIYVTNIFGTVQGVDEHNVLFVNQSTKGGLAFVESAVALGVDNGGGGWGASFFDADNDSDLDLLAVNGTEPINTMPWRLFLNDLTRVGTPSFRSVERAVGFDRLEYGSCAITFDMDRDGDLDVAVTTNIGRIFLFENEALEARGRHWLVVRPRSSGANTRGIGAVVRVVIGARTLSRPITCGTSMMGQEPAEAHFGLGRETLIDRVIVEWPDGGVTIVEDVAPDQVLDVVRGG